MSSSRIGRIALVTDFGPSIYVGQVEARLSTSAPGIPAIDLIHDLPPFRPDLAAYLLPALMRDMPSATLYICVVDPGVGGDRAGLAVRAGDDWIVGPDNGLLGRVIARNLEARVYRIDWRPEKLSASFHGRDWFSEVAARLLRNDRRGLSEIAPADTVGADWADDLPSIVYADSYGNLMTGLRADRHPNEALLIAGGQTLANARTFCETEPGSAFWYENSLGLIELAVNRGRADRALGLTPGDPVSIAL